MEASFKNSKKHLLAHEEDTAVLSILIYLQQRNYYTLILLNYMKEANNFVHKFILFIRD